MWLRTVMVFIYDDDEKKNPCAAHPPSNLFSSVQQQSVLISEQSCVLKEKVLAFAKMYLGEPRSAMLRRSNTSKKPCEITREKSGWFINRNLPQQTGCAQFHRRSSDLRGKKNIWKFLNQSRETHKLKQGRRNAYRFPPSEKKRGESEGLSVAKAKRRKKEAKLHWNKIKHTQNTTKI